MHALPQKMNRSLSGVSNGYRMHLRLLVLSVLLYPGVAHCPLTAMPAYVPLEKRAAESMVVLVADVVSSESRNVNQSFNSAEVHLKVRCVMKRPKGLVVPGSMVLQFAVYPESFEARMRTPPTPGRYFVFLDVVEQAVAGESKKLILYRLYEPNPFAFDQWNGEAEAKLARSLTGGIHE